MKKVMYLFIIIFFIILIINKTNTNNDISVMKYEDDSNISNIYYLDYSNEVLSTNNFKLKISPLKYYDYVIRKIYPKYNGHVKEYYTYDFSNTNSIDNFKEDYLNLLRNNHMYEEIDKTKMTGIIIKGLEIYTTKEAIENYLKKYPKVKYKEKREY